MAYGADPNQFGDLWLPQGEGRHPVVVFLHGGYWRAKYDISYTHPLAADLAKRGIAVWNLEYRRVGQEGGGWQGTFEDVARGYKLLDDLIQPHQLDHRRVVAMGHSAGGHLAFWLAAGAPLLQGAPEAYLPLRAAVSLAGVLDLQRAWELHLSNDAVVDLLGGTPAECHERYVAASPAAHLPLHLPQILFHGTADTSVPYTISEDYARKALEAGDDADGVRLITQQGADHFEMVTPGTPEWEQVCAVLGEVLSS